MKKDEGFKEQQYIQRVQNLLSLTEQNQKLAAQYLDLSAPEEDGEGNRPGAKRIACEVLSVAAFLALIMLAVYGADSFAAWLKGMLGMG